MKRTMSATTSPHASVPSAGACPANIGPAERRKRWIVAIIALAMGVGAALLLSLQGAPRSWRLLLLLPFWMAALGVFQARAQVCVAFAARGVRNLDGTQEAQPEAELAAVRKEARSVHVRALLTALVLTALCVLLTP